MRMLVAITIWILSFLLISKASIFVFQFFGGQEMLWYGFAMGTAIWMYTLGATLSYFTVSVPEVSGLITINLLGGRLKAYLPGLHFKYITEQVKEENFFSLELIREPFCEEFPSKDGPIMIVEGGYQYEADPNRLGRFIRVDESVIKNGIIDAIKSILSQRISGMEAIDVRESVEKLGKYVDEEFSKDTGTGKSLESEYAIKIRRVLISDIEYEKPFQDALTTRRSMDTLREAARRSMKASEEAEDEATILYGDAMNNTLIVHGKVTKHVVEAQGQSTESAIAALLGALSGRGESYQKKSGDE